MTGTLFLIAGLLVSQAPDADPALRLEVRRLVRQLDAPQLAQREQAEQKLVDRGPDVLDLLPPDSDHTAAEVRQRLGRVRQKLQRVLAESVTQGSRVTLAGDGLPLSKILAAFQEQTANRFADDHLAPNQAGEPVLSVAFNQTPFWKALDEVLDGAGASIDPYGAQGEIRLQPRGDSEQPRSNRASYSGPFRFEAVRIDALRDLRDPEGRSLRLTLEVAWEPRLAPITLKQRLADVKAVDENGNPLPVDSRQAEFEVPLRPDSFAVSLTIPLALPSRDVRRIARLEGSLTAMVPARVETFRFENLEAADDVQKRIAGVTVLLDRVRENNSIWEVLVRVGFDKADGALASHRNWIYDNEAYLEDPQGRPVPYDAFETTRQTEDEVGMAYLFAVDGPLTGYKFVYKTPGLILSRTVEYQIEDVPLP